MVREFSDAALQGCREKALQKTDAFIKRIPEGMDDVEKFEVLSKHWRLIKTCSGQCGDNFDRELFIERNNNQHPENRLRNLLESYLVSVFQMEALTQEMGKLECTRVNGASVAFAAYCNQTNEIVLPLDCALTVYQRGPFSVGEVHEMEEPPALRA